MREVKGSIFHSKQVSDNIEEVPRLDSFVKDGLPEKSKKINYLQVENALGKLHPKIKDAYGPLAKI